MRHLDINKNCTNCGAPITSGTEECMYCGTALRPASSVPVSVFPESKGRKSWQRMLLISVSLLALASIVAFVLYAGYKYFADESMTYPGVLATILPADQLDVMIDLNKGIRHFRVLRGNQYPTSFDSLIQVKTATGLDQPQYIEIGMASGKLVMDKLSVDQFAKLANVGIDSFMYIAEDQNPSGAGECVRGEIAGLIQNRRNNVSSSTIFLPANSHGCGAKVTYLEGSSGQGRNGHVVVTRQNGEHELVNNSVTALEIPVMMWRDGSGLLTGQPQMGAYNADGNTAFLVVGIGRSSNLFSPSHLGAIAYVPRYKNAGTTSYNRFMVVFSIGKYQSGKIVMNERVNLIDILGGFGETESEVSGAGGGSLRMTLDRSLHTI